MKKNKIPYSLFAFLIIIGFSVFFLQGMSEKNKKENAKAIEKNIRNAATSCYAIEGAYPQNIEYLEKNYGLIIDKDGYAVQYEATGSNFMPSIIVTPKGTYHFDEDWS